MTEQKYPEVEEMVEQQTNEHTDATEPQSDAEERETNEQQQEEQTEQAQPSGELEELRKQADEHYQRYLRTQADFDNFRRRSRQEKEEFAKYASAELIRQLLPVMDNFERALVTSKDNPDFDGLLKGVDMIYRQVAQVLGQEGLEKIEAVGQPFDPEFHQAIMQVESDEHEEGIVVEEMQAGYKLKDKVLRPSMVKVSS